MQKYGVNEGTLHRSADLKPGNNSSSEIVSEEILLSGLYRVRRGDLLYQIAKANCCSGYRDSHNSSAIKFVFFGTEFDIFNTRAIFAAAEMLALRVMPLGDRSWRTAWWHGYTRGIMAKLHKANREFIREYRHEHAALALVTRSEHAENEMLARIQFGLTSHRGYVSGSVKAYRDGERAAVGFSNGKNEVRRNLPRSLSR